LAAFLLAFVCCLENQSVLAGSATWNGTTNSTWFTSTNRTAGGPPGTGNTATFSNAGNGNTTLDLGAGVTVNTVLFDTSSVAVYTIYSDSTVIGTLTPVSAYGS
jgi:fibronectin-binding autotransporter adhesin